MRLNYDFCRTRLGRIRCLKECLKAYENAEPFPDPLCYVCEGIEHVISKSHINTYTNPVTGVDGAGSKTLTETLVDAIPIGKIVCDSQTRLYTNSEPFVTRYGVWLKLFRVKQKAKTADEQLLEFSPSLWILVQSNNNDEPPYVEPKRRDHELFSDQSEEWKHHDGVKVRNWLSCVEVMYSVGLGNKPQMEARDEETIAELRHIPTNWSPECDAQLVNFLCGVIDIGAGNLGSVKNYVDSIEVSTACCDDNENNLIDGNPDTYWESDGNHGQHWIRLKMKKGTIISRLFITLDLDDDNYLPNHIVVAGGELQDMQTLNDMRLNLAGVGRKDECVLQDMTKHYSFIEIRIKGCKDDGIDTRIHGIKIVSSKEVDMGLSLDTFADNSKLSRYPVLENFGRRVLYRRAQALQRLVTLIDSVLNFLVPAWSDSGSTLNLMQNIKQLIPLSRKRLSLIDTFIRESESPRPNSFPRLLINRRAAADHKSDPSADPEGSATVFHQIYEGLKPRNAAESSLDYRWPGHCEQWWECKFVSEGIIDQGGGFRDSLCDIAEELCPPTADSPLPLQYFIRAPNQMNADSNASRDVFIPNPAYHKYSQYRWIGQLMGACLRGKESLVLSLPGLVWKKLTNERVTWAADFSSVDAAEVRSLDTMERIDEEGFEVHFGEKTWSATLSDGTVVELRPGGAQQPVYYSERLQYSAAVQQVRMQECDRQINAMREGFLSVIPEAIVTLLTWQEVEIRVCGNPEIALDALRRSVHYDDLDASDDRIKVFWQVMETFTNDDRSRFLRFVTGRKRLPCPLYISPNKSSAVDSLPESSTCSNTLYLPRYSSLKKAEEKLRYAAYNCIAIDTDVNPWD